MEFLPESYRQFLRYGIIGVSNTILNMVIFNILIWVTGVSIGGLVVLFSLITFVVVVIYSFFMNKRFVFNVTDEADKHRKFVNFFVVSGSVALINLGVIHLVVNIIGAPTGVSTHLWANVAILITIAVSVLGNFFGYKYIVFREKKV